jgi:simple sugar transport system permease protein
MNAPLANTDELGRRMLARLRVSPAGWFTTGLTVVLIAVALALAALLIGVTGGSPTASLNAIWTGSMANSGAWSTTLLNAAPLLLVAVGTCICAMSGWFNIGQEGQVLIGGLFGAWAGLRFAVPGPLLAVVVLVAAIIGGGVWAGICALMQFLRGVNLTVSTLLMNFVAIELVAFAVNTPWLLQETAQGPSGIANSQSNPLPKNGLVGGLGQYPGLQLNIGLFIALISAIVVALLLVRSRWGFRLRMVGLNPLTARHAGVRVAWAGGIAVALSGAFAGLAGGVLLASPVSTNQLTSGLSNNVGWDGLLVALMARQRPLAAIPVALLFGVLRSGGNFLSSTGVPYYLVNIVQSLLVLAVVAPPVVVDAWRRRRRSTSTPAPSPAIPSQVEVAA